MSSCKHPIRALRNRVTGGLTFRPGDADSNLDTFTVPCGQCVACRLNRSRDWAVRIMHECQSHERSAFLTLTYRDEDLPSNGSLDHRHVQLFFKRLRKSIAPKRIKFFVAGEYGDKLGRPHYHAILFGHWFDDSVKFVRSESGYWLYRSDVLDGLWRHGHCQIGSVEFESAQYVAKYCLKKVTGDGAEAHYNGRKPEYATMSRGVGFDWISKFVDEVYASDEVIVNGVPCQPPRYYDKYLESIDPDRWDKVKRERASKPRKALESSPRRLAAQEEVLLARTNLYGER